MQTASSCQTCQAAWWRPSDPGRSQTRSLRVQASATSAASTGESGRRLVGAVSGVTTVETAILPGQYQFSASLVAPPVIRLLYWHRQTMAESLGWHSVA